MWEFVDKVIYINLDHRQDRRDIMKLFFEKGQIPEDKIVRFPAIKGRKTGEGCLLSHTGVLILAKQNGWKNILILEDDLQWLDFEPAYKQLCELVEKPKWDVILLTGFYRKYDFPRIYSSTNSGAYLVNEFYIDTLLENRRWSVKNFRNILKFDKGLYSADVAWDKLMEKDTWFCLYPCICSQVDGISDSNNNLHLEASQIVGIFDPEIHARVFKKVFYKR
jgi:glycosyl transferase family 25